MSIPIRNIYYLLCYAWNVLPERTPTPIGSEDSIGLADLLADQLLKGSRILLKRGIEKNYINHTGEVAGIKGKLDLSATLKSNLLPRRTICVYDEFSQNTLANQILFTSLFRLSKTDGIQRSLQAQIRSLLPWFGAISKIHITASHFSSIRLHHNNKSYGLLLHICRLLHENLIPAEQSGSFHFSDFTKDEPRMRLLFEAFIRNFYILEQSVYRVSRKNYQWKLKGLDVESDRYLPLMKTDIMLENKDRRIIIDAKFYKETMVTNYTKEKIRSAHLYQLFSYLMNQEEASDEVSMNATGMLIYPTITADYDLHYQFREHLVLIKTVNLNADWKHIKRRLLDIALISTS